MEKKIYAHAMIYPWRCVATRERVCLRTLVDRTAEALVNAVDVVERPHVPRSAPRSVHDLVPNGRHLRVQHTYSSTMILVFLIQQERRRGRRVLRQRDGAPEVGDDLVSAGLRPSSAETRSRGKNRGGMWSGCRGESRLKSALKPPYI